MRSEVVNVKSYTDQWSYVSQDGTNINSSFMSRMLPEIPVGETRPVRITVEIEEEKKGEQKVGSKALIKCGAEGGVAFLNGFRCPIFDPTVHGWQPGESRRVRSINFETESGVPEVVFVETPLERLKRVVGSAELESGLGASHRILMDGVRSYISAVEADRGKA